jgi:hypothetical protein
LHEAAHAVIALYLRLSFTRVTRVEIFDKDANILKPPGVWNLEGPCEEVRVTALTGCTLEVLNWWDGLLVAQQRLKKQENQHDVVRKWMATRFKLDLACYHNNQEIRTQEIEDADLALSEKYVRQLMPEIEQVAIALDAYPLGMLTFDQVKQICKFTS